MTETKILPLLTWRRQIAESDLGPTTKLVAFALSLWMNERGASAYPGAQLLASDTSLSVRAVRDHLQALVDLGWLELVERGGMRGRKKTANVYRAMVPDPRLPLDGGTSCTRAAGSPVQEDALTPAPDDVDPCTTFTPSLQDLFKNSSGDAPPGAPDSRIATLVGGYVDDYRITHDGHDPSTRWKAAAGRAVREALRDDETPDAIARCLGVCAAENKVPTALVHVLADLHAGRERRR